MKALLSVAFEVLVGALVLTAINFVFEVNQGWPTREQLGFYLSILALVKIHGLKEGRP